MTVSVDSQVADFLPKRKFHVPKDASASVATGYPRQGGGSQVLGSIVVPIMDDAAGLTGPFTNRKTERPFSLRPTVRAELGRREPAAQPPVEGAAGCASTTIKERRLNVVRIEADALAEDDHFAGLSINSRTASRTTAAIESSLRFASKRSHANSGGSNWMVSGTTRNRFFGGGMDVNVAPPEHHVKMQLGGFLVDSQQTSRIIGEREVRQRA